jgi:hypothetical protein
MSHGTVVRSPAYRCAQWGFGRSSIARWVAILALSACSAGSMGGASADAVGPSGAAAQSQSRLETQQACRGRVNETFEKQNRPAIYAANSSLNTPFSANFQPQVPDRGLSDQFAFERAVAQCESNAPTGPDVQTSMPASSAPVVKGR